MAKMSKPEYEEKVKKLSREETERLLSRMTGKLPHRLEKEKLSKEEALAIQMELEDEQLQEWRRMMAILNKKAAPKTKEKSAKGTDKPKKTPASETGKKAAPKAGTVKRQATAQPKAKTETGKPAAK